MDLPPWSKSSGRASSTSPSLARSARHACLSRQVSCFFSKTRNLLRCGHFRFFPTCQVRVVRFYVSPISSISSFASSSPGLFVLKVEHTYCVLTWLSYLLQVNSVANRLGLGTVWDKHSLVVFSNKHNLPRKKIFFGPGNAMKVLFMFTGDYARDGKQRHSQRVSFTLDVPRSRPPQWEAREAEHPTSHPGPMDSSPPPES